MRLVVLTTSEARDARSAQMARIRARDTKPEMRVRRALHSAGLRYRLHAKGLPGKPDIVFPRARVALFVHGCFWHQHPDPACKLARMPKSRLEFWRPKLEGNRARDERIRVELEKLGWAVIEVWECQTKSGQLAQLADKVRDNVRARLAKGKDR